MCATREGHSHLKSTRTTNGMWTKLLIRIANYEDMYSATSAILDTQRQKRSHVFRVESRGLYNPPTFDPSEIKGDSTNKTTSP